MLKKSPFNRHYFTRCSLILFLFFIFTGTILAKEPTSDLEEAVENKDAQVLHHLGYRSSTGFMAGSFTEEGVLPQENEFVDEVTFFCNEKESQYKITVITESEEGSLRFGKIRYVQEGRVSSSGYQKVSLNKGVLLSQAEKFALVIELRSPTETKPLTTVEPPGNFDDQIGETFLSRDGIHWEAHPFIGIGVGLKKEDSIEASIKETEVKHGDWLYLSGKELLKNGEVSLDPLENTFENKKEVEIYYSLDGSNPEESGFFYDADEGIFVNAYDFTNEHLLIRACVLGESESPRTTDFNYTLKKAGLSQLKVIDEWGEKNLELKENNVVDILSKTKTIEVQATAEAGCQIKINDQVMLSGSKQKIDLKGEEDEIRIDVYDKNQEIWEEEQLKPSTYFLKILKKPVIYDFENEKIIFDQNQYAINSLSNSDGIELLSGEVISPYFGGNLYVTPKDKEAESFSLSVPTRPEILDLSLDFKTKKTMETLSKEIVFGFDSELKDPMRGRDQEINLSPGRSLYYRKIANENQFASEIKKLEVPEVPKSVTPKAQKTETNKIILESEKNTVYRKNHGNWQTSPMFEGLKSGETYTFEAQKNATENSFRSKIGSAEITTRKMILENQIPYFEYFPKKDQEQMVIKKVEALKTGSIKESVMVIVMGLFGCGILLFIILSYVYAFEEKKKKEKH